MMYINDVYNFRFFPDNDHFDKSYLREKFKKSYLG